MRGNFFRAKGVVEEIFALLKEEPRFEAGPHPFMASPASARVQGGWVAQLDPRLLEGEWSAFELDLAELFAQVPERILYEDVITFPAVKEDLAFAVDESVPAGDLSRRRARRPGRSCATCGSSTSTVASRSAPGKKSLAFAVTFQSAERTLSDEDAAVLRGRIVAALRDALRRRVARLARRCSDG